jgi:four helix bundle protein
MDEPIMLAHEKLKVYQCSIEFLALCSQMIERFPRGHAYLSDQLKRASLSIPLNIAEAAGRSSQGEGERFYGIARGSAMECGAILDACGVLRLADEYMLQKGKSLLVRIVSMLSKMCR